MLKLVDNVDVSLFSANVRRWWQTISSG